MGQCLKKLLGIMMSWTFKVCVILQLISLSQGSDDDFEVSVTSRNLEDSTIINGAQDTTENVSDFTVIEVIDDSKCKCRRKAKFCEDGEKPIMRRGTLTCLDGSKAKCPVHLCRRQIVTIDDIALPSENRESIKDRNCKCRRRDRVCNNGESELRRKRKRRCKDGSRPRCPTEFCFNIETSSSSSLGDIELVTAIHEESIDVEFVLEEFSTTKNIDPFATENPSQFPEMIEIFTELPNQDDLLETVKEFITEKHVDDFPKLEAPVTEDDRVFPSLFSKNSLKNVSMVSQCQQEGIVTCEAVELDLQLLKNIKEGNIVMLLSNSNFTMELTSSENTGSSTSYSFHLSTGGSASFTVGENSKVSELASVFESVNTLSNWIINIEPCGQDCLVMYWRDIDFFNQFEDR